jgi:hypothetical protein
MSNNRTITILHSNNSGEVSTFRVELPPSIAEGSSPIDIAVRSAYVQGFSAGAQYATDQETKIIDLEGQFVAPAGELAA